MSEGSDERQQRDVGLRVAAVLLGMALLSGGLWGWRSWRAANAPPQPVVWLLEPGTVKGRVIPELEVTLEADGESTRVTLLIPKRGMFGDMTKSAHGSKLGSGGKPDRPRWASFLMMDGADRVYAGFVDGKVRRWNGGDRHFNETEVAGEERAQVVAAYAEKTGRAWQAEVTAPVGAGVDLIWLLKEGTVQGRVNPDLWVVLRRSVSMPEGAGVTWVSVVKLGARNEATLNRRDAPGGVWDYFLMMDEEDRIYVGYGDGEIHRWSGEGDTLDHGIPVGVERARVVAAYAEKTGRAWQARVPAPEGAEGAEEGR